MARFSGDPKTIWTSSSQRAVHLAHLRHLAKESTARQHLRTQFDFTRIEAKRHARLFAQHLEQGLEFLDASKCTGSAVQPLLTYYGYAKLASAVTLAYRSRNWDRIRHHGLSSLITPTSKPSLTAKVLDVRAGLIAEFHSVYCDSEIPTKLTLRDILGAISLVSDELTRLFGQRIESNTLMESVVRSPSDKTKYTLQIAISAPRNEDGKPQYKVARRAMERAIPFLKYDYVCTRESNVSA